MDYEITPAEVKRKLESREHLILLDVREPEECAIARIEGAKLMPMGAVPSRAHLELDPDEHIVALPSWGALVERGELATTAGI